MYNNKVKHLATGGGGIGNQIKKLISAKRLHPDSQTDLGYFSDLFANPNLYHNGKRSGVPMCTWRILVFPEDIEIPTGLNTHTRGIEITANSQFDWYDQYSHWSFNEDGRNVDCEYTKIPKIFTDKILKIINEHFTINPNIEQWVNKFRLEFPQYSSLHIRSYNSDDFCKNGANRGGDNNPRAKARHNYYINNQRNLIYEYLNNLKNDLVYISSDNRNEIELIKTRFPQKTFIHYTDLFEKPFSSDYSNDFLDMVLLSKGIEMILCRISTYSEVAWYLSECNQNIKIY